MSRHPDFYNEGIFRARLTMNHLVHEADRAVRMYDQLMQAVLREIHEAGQAGSEGAILSDFLEDYDKWRVTHEVHTHALPL